MIISLFSKIRFDFLLGFHTKGAVPTYKAKIPIVVENSIFQEICMAFAEMADFLFKALLFFLGIFHTA